MLHTGRERPHCRFRNPIPSLTKAAKKSKGKLFPFGFTHFLKAIKKNDTLDLYLIAVRPELRSKGVPYILISEITKRAIQNGVVRGIASPELETNHAVHSMWRSFERRIHRRRRCFIKRFDTGSAGAGEAKDNGK